MIDVVSLSKRFGATQAVDGVSFRVEKGETFGLLGPNGAGKTTTLHLLLGLLAPDQGSMTIGPWGSPQRASTRQHLGLAPQQLSLYLELTADENLAFFAKLYGLAGKQLRKRVDWAIELAALEDRRRHRIKTFSGGMLRRLNLAVALVHDPQVILLDEPTVGVDPQSRNHIFERIEHLRAEGRTIVYTTHYMEEAERLCDRVAIMDQGKLRAVDSVDALIEQYGGRSVVRCELHGLPPDAAVLPAPLDELSLRFESEQPLEEIGRLASAGVSFRSLEVARPDLETVFLSVTGRRLRD